MNKIVFSANVLDIQFAAFHVHILRVHVSFAHCFFLYKYYFFSSQPASQRMVHDLPFRILSFVRTIETAVKRNIISND